jgi:hypothetical protein
MAWPAAVAAPRWRLQRQGDGLLLRGRPALGPGRREGRLAQRVVRGLHRLLVAAVQHWMEGSA